MSQLSLSSDRARPTIKSLRPFQNTSIDVTSIRRWIPYLHTAV